MLTDDRRYIYLTSKAYSRKKFSIQFCPRCMYSASVVFKTIVFNQILLQKIIQNALWEVMCFMLDCYSVQLFFQSDH